MFQSFLQVQAVGQDRFRSVRNEGNAYGILFGGQMLAQAVASACATVDGKVLHSLHVNFIKTGKLDVLPEYAVERLRDGREIATRVVRATQDHGVLLIATASFKAPGQGFDHSRPKATSMQPEAAIDFLYLATLVPNEARMLFEFVAEKAVIDVRVAGRAGITERTGPDARRAFWMRVRDMDRNAPADLHQALFAYLSDFLFAGASVAPHTVPLPGPHIRSVSLDHVIWFHRPVDCSQWLLFETEGTSAAGGCGLTQGWVYNEDGALVASLAQESLQNATAP